MQNVRILDCTLRDGGYINDFCFGNGVIKSIISKLSKASIDIIECGFLKKDMFNEDCSLFGSVDFVETFIKEKNPNSMYVAMLQFGKIGIEDISDCKESSIDGIRVTFHEHEIIDAFVLGKQLMDKGYKVFMQPVGTMTYTDEDLLLLIQKINNLKPYAFYMVDTLGTMYQNDLLRMFFLIDNNLDKNICLGFHSHNNLQLSFANAQELIQMRSNRSIIIDTSIYGMGRGAGNLNTELMTQYINTNFELKYDNMEILEIIDEYIGPLRLKYSWGYDIAYFIASTNECHPNYASYLINKQTMNAKSIHAVLNSLDDNKRAIFDRDYVREKYKTYMSQSVDDRATIGELRVKLQNRKLLLLAPGHSLKISINKINDIVAHSDYYVMSVNFIPQEITVDAMFISNMKRFKGLANYRKTFDCETVIATSNILSEETDKIKVINYSDYLNEESCILDNSGLMCLNLLKKIGVESVLLAGFDGFSENFERNYYDSRLWLESEKDRLREKNLAAHKKICQLRTQMKIEFLMDSLYQNGGNVIE